MTMQRIMSNILQQSEFSIESLVLSSVAGRKSLDKSEQGPGQDFTIFGTCATPGIDNHYFVVFVDKIPDNFVTEDSPGYSAALRDYLGERFAPSMPKNFSLILCWEREVVEDFETINAQILQIEEDPFDFKKYVLMYSQSEVDELHSDWERSEMSMIPFLNHYLYEDGKFTRFKNRTATPAYNLVTRLFIKVPFLKLHVKERTFEDLQEVIRESLQEDLTDLRDRLLEVSPDEFIKELREMEPNET